MVGEDQYVGSQINCSACHGEIIVPQRMQPVSTGTNPKFAPLQKIYAGSYAMRLEFGESIRGKLPVTIYVALPDSEKSFVGGRFKVDDFRKRFNSDGEEI